MPASSDAQTARRAMTHVVDAEPRHFDLLQDTPRLGQEDGPRLGERDGPVRPVQQTYPELLFELADLLADRRLRNVQSCCGPAEVQVLRDSYEISEVAKFHERPRA